MLRLTGCRLVAKDMRILPTDLAVIVLNENDRYINFVCERCLSENIMQVMDAN